MVKPTYLLLLGYKEGQWYPHTFTDPMVRVEAFSTVWQTVALTKSLGMDAGCTVSSCRSRAAGTGWVTNWGGERSTAGCRHHSDTSWLVSLSGVRGDKLADSYIVRTAPVTHTELLPKFYLIISCLRLQFSVLWHLEVGIGNHILQLGKLLSGDVKFSPKGLGR